MGNVQKTLQHEAADMIVHLPMVEQAKADARKKQLQRQAAMHAAQARRRAAEAKRTAMQKQRAPPPPPALLAPHTFTDVLESSLQNQTVLVSSLSGGIVGLVAGGDNRIPLSVLGAAAPVIAHVIYEMQKPELIMARPGTFKVISSTVEQVDDGHY